MDWQKGGQWSQNIEKCSHQLFEEEKKKPNNGRGIPQWNSRRYSKRASCQQQQVWEHFYRRHDMA